MNEPNEKAGFEMRKVAVELNRLVTTRVVREPQKLPRYRAIVDSIQELGLIEPLMVHPEKSGNKWLVLDGHLRLLALKQLGSKMVEVIVAGSDDQNSQNIAEAA